MPDASNRYFRLGGVIALLILLFAGAWLGLPHIMRMVAQSVAERNGLESVIVEVDSVRLDNTVFRRVSFHSKTDYGPVVVDLRNLTARYRLVDLSVIEVTAETGEISWRQAPPKTEESGTVAAGRLPPIPPMRIKHAQVTMDSEWGRSAFAGELELATRDGNTVALFTDPRQKLELAADPERLNAAVVITAGGESVAKLTASDPFTADTKLDGTVQLHQLRKWSLGNPLIPENVRATLQEISIDHGTLSLNGQLKTTGDRFEFTGDGQSAWRGLRQQGMVLAGHVDFKVLVKNDQLRLTVSPKSRLRFTDVRWGDEKASIIAPEASFDIQAELHAVHGDGGWRTTVDSFVANANALEVYLDPSTPVRAQQLRLSGKVVPLAEHSRVELRASATHPALPSLNIIADVLNAEATFNTDRRLQATGSFTAAGVRMRDWPKAMNALSLAGKFDHQDRRITATGGASLDKKMFAKWRLGPRGTALAAIISIDELDISNLWSFVQPLFDKNWLGLKFVSGALSGNARFVWNGDTKSTLELSGAGIKGSIDNTEFTHLDINLLSQDVFAGDYVVHSNVAQAKVAGEMMVTDIAVGLRILDTAITVDSASMHILDGVFAVKPTTTDLSNKDHRVAVSVTGLDFGRLLAMIDQPGLSGSGRLDGTIPLALLHDGIEIKDAEFHSTIPGSLRYHTAGPAMAPTDNIALQALQDFRYDTLKISISYDPGGDYRIRMRLEGRNPELYNGYPIAFNLNLTGELPMMLRSQLLKGDFAKQILRDIQINR